MNRTIERTRRPVIAMLLRQIDDLIEVEVTGNRQSDISGLVVLGVVLPHLLGGK